MREPVRSPASTPVEQPQSAAAKLFDLRILIGGLFVLYGVILIVAGFLVSSAQLRKAAGININLWVGIGMLALGLLFLLWWRLRPLQAEPSPAPPSMQPEPPPNRGR